MQTMSKGITVFHPPPPPQLGEHENQAREEDGISLDEFSALDTPLDLDIIAVHGLNGNPFRTWTDPESKKLWLRDILPDDLPRARIMAFGYAAGPVLQSSVAEVRDHARDLLACLAEKRRREDELQRPMILVGHSLGGLVIEQAMVIASQEQSYQDIDQNVTGVIFFGTPHMGSSHAKLARWVAKFPNTMARKPESALLKFLGKDSKALKVLDEEFKRVLGARAYDIVTFYETRTLTGFRTLIVDKQSAVLGVPGESRSREVLFPVNEDHRRMCRFSSSHDTTYKRFLENTKRIVSKSEPADIGNEHYVVPRQVNPNFTGRKDICQKLIDSLTPGRHRRAGTQRRYVLYGIGGAGKTQIAAKFTQDCRNRFWGIFWIDASSNEAAQEGFMTIARGCGQVENVDSVKTWLSGKDDWLLIIDNADDQNLDISKFFPIGNRGSIVITTRISDSRKYQTVGFDKVERMHLEDAITLLLKSAAVQDLRNAEMRALAADIVELLGSLALAIIQAGAVLRQQLCSFSGFCELYSQRKQDLLDSGGPLPTEDYQYSVCTTWEISIEKIRDMPDTHAILALELLMSFSFMHFEGIREDLFKKARANVDLGYWESWDDFVREILFIKFMPSGCDQLLIGRALGLLAGLSLININEDREISIHPLVHEWARHRMSKDEHEKYWLITAATMAMSTNRRRSISEYKQRRLLLPHVDFLLRYEDGQLFSEGRNLKERLDASFLFAAVYFENSQLDKALKISLQDQKWKETMFPPGHISRSTTTVMTAGLLALMGRVDEVVSMTIPLIEGLRQVGDDKGILNSMNNIAIAYVSVGKHQEAVDKCKEALERFEQTFGSENRQILDTMTIMARCYLIIGRPKDALKLGEKVLEVGMRLPTEHHSSLLASMRLVAEEHAALKHFIKARRVQEMYLCRLAEVDGRNHPKTISGLNTMAEYQNKFGKFLRSTTIRGLVCRIEVVERSKSAFGKTDPRTLEYLELLAHDYYNRLCFTNAEQVQEEVVKEKVRTYGKDHDEAVVSIEFLAQIRRARKLHRTIYWWVPRARREMDFLNNSSTAQHFRKSKIIAGL